MEEEFFDSVIIGRGLAGLSTAIETTKEKNTAVFFSEEKKSFESSSFNAQGGISAAIAKNDLVKEHFNDTVRAGAGLCEEKIVKILVEKGKEKVLELIEQGFEFDENEKGISLGLEAGHSKNRVLHADGDNIGREITKFYFKLAKEKNIHFFPEQTLKEVIIENNSGKAAVFEDFTAKFNSLVFASGGYSSLYGKSTNPKGNLGEANSIALKAGVHLMDLEFEQFHPTTIKGNNFLLSETLRGEGAFLVNDLNEKFMRKFEGKDLATRDIVSQEIFLQINSGRKVFLDCTKIENLKQRFPSIYKKTRELGLKIEEKAIEIEPAAHYSIGGIKIDENARTNIRNIFAAGECSCSGLHGANRLASNSLLEAMVFGSIAGRNSLKEKNEKSKTKIELKTKESNSDFNLNNLKELMRNFVGIQRNENGLKKALQEIRKMQENNSTFLAEKIIESALNREESRGCHFRTDFPETKKNAVHSVLSE